MPPLGATLREEYQKTTGATPSAQYSSVEEARLRAQREQAQPLISAAQAGNQAAQAMFGLGKTQLLSNLAEGHRQQQVGHDALQTQAAVTQNGHNQHGKGHEVASSRNSAAAGYLAQSAQQTAERDVVATLSGELAAIGAGGAVLVGPKPVGLDGMSRDGQLGPSLQAQAEYAERGFMQFVTAGQNELQAAYGYQQVAQQYAQGNGDVELQKMPFWARAAQAIGDALSAGGKPMKPESPAASPTPIPIPLNANRGTIGV